MRCVNPAGFPPKWLYVISMHSLGKSIPFFNYVRIQGVVGRRVMKMCRAQQGGVRNSRFPRMMLPLVISSSNNAPRKTRKRKSLTWHIHTPYAHVGTNKHTVAAICRCDFIRIQVEPARTVTLTALLHFNFLFLKHTQTNSILNS